MRTREFRRERRTGRQCSASTAHHQPAVAFQQGPLLPALLGRPAIGRMLEQHLRKTGAAVILFSPRMGGGGGGQRGRTGRDGDPAAAAPKYSAWNASAVRLRASTRSIPTQAPAPACAAAPPALAPEAPAAHPPPWARRAAAAAFFADFAGLRVRGPAAAAADSTAAAKASRSRGCITARLCPSRGALAKATDVAAVPRSVAILVWSVLWSMVPPAAATMVPSSVRCLVPAAGERGPGTPAAQQPARREARMHGPRGNQSCIPVRFEKVVFSLTYDVTEEAAES